MRLEGKIGLVTAAASGAGRAGAIRFAREGAQVAVVDIDPAAAKAVVDEITAAGGSAVAVVGDLREDAFSRQIVHDTVAAFGGLDFVWDHVGHPGPSAVEEVDLELFDIAVDLNLRTLLVTAGEAIPQIRKRGGGGAMLFTASTAGVYGSPRSPVYSAMKFGVVGFSRSLAKRLAPDGIRVNVICPGGIDTPMYRVFVARADQTSTFGKDPEELAQAAAKTYPMGRIARPEEIANAALFLLSDEASYVSGAVLSVDGCVTA